MTKNETPPPADTGEGRSEVDIEDRAASITTAAAEQAVINIFDLPVHPKCAMLPEIGADELTELAQDIQEHGLREPVTIWRGQLIDGRNRRRACKMIALVPDWVEFEGATEAEVVDFIISKNIHRRHLQLMTQEQRRDLIAKLLEARPDRSDHATGKIIGASHHTVAKVRAEREDVGRLPTSTKRTDTKGRTQPAKKPAKPRAKPRAQQIAAAPSPRAAAIIAAIGAATQTGLPQFEAALKRAGAVVEDLVRHAGSVPEHLRAQNTHFILCFIDDLKEVAALLLKPAAAP